MSTFKRARVLMLPTNEKASIKLGQNGLLVRNTLGYDAHFINQNLYFLSDEGIREGDWYIDETDEIRQSVTSDKDYWSRRKNDKKIIATTDESLFEQIMYYPDGSIIGGIESYKILPQPSDSFIQKYVEEYNKGNIITNVMVEYEDNGSEEWYGDDYNGEPYWNEKIELKINPKNNTITIRRVKDSWNREEVIELLKKSKTDFPLHRGIQLLDEEFNEWIEKNL